MNWITIVLVLIVGFATYRAYRAGLVRELVSLAAVVLAIPVAGLFYDDLYPKVEPIIDNSLLAALVSFLALAGGVFIAGQVAAHSLKQGVAMLNLGTADNLAGAAVGFLKGMLICQVLLIALVVFPKPDMRDDIDNSPVANAMIQGAPMVLALLPGGFDNSVSGFLDGIFQQDDAPDPVPPDEARGPGSTADGT
ncbi:MAG: CvpA family protein [Dehalococcoidia bacterium]|nr:CvpA family protein [Dehalococcoidia bacterium]